MTLNREATIYMYFPGKNVFQNQICLEEGLLYIHINPHFETPINQIFSLRNIDLYFYFFSAVKDKRLSARQEVKTQQ